MSRLVVGFGGEDWTYPFVFNCSNNKENTEPCGSEAEIIKSIEKVFPVKLDWIFRNNPVQSLLNNTIDVVANTMAFIYYNSRFKNKLRWTPVLTDRYAVFSSIVMQQENAFTSWLKLLTPHLVILNTLVYLAAKLLMLLSKSKYVRADGTFKYVAKLVHLIILLYETIALGVLGNALAVIFSKASIIPTPLPYTPEEIETCLSDFSCKLFFFRAVDQSKVLPPVKSEHIMLLNEPLNRSSINNLTKKYENVNTKLIFMDYVSRSFIYSHSSANSQYPMMYHLIEGPGVERFGRLGFLTSPNKSRFVDETLSMLLASIDAQKLYAKETAAIAQQSGMPPLLFNSPEMNSLTYQAFPELTLSKFIPCGYLLAAGYSVGLLVLMLEIIFKTVAMNRRPDTTEEFEVFELEPQSSGSQITTDEMDCQRYVCNKLSSKGVLSHDLHKTCFNAMLEVMENY